MARRTSILIALRSDATVAGKYFSLRCYSSVGFFQHPYYANCELQKASMVEREPVGYRTLQEQLKICFGF
jgi:hypothetical protein